MSVRSARYQGETLAATFGPAKPPVDVHLIAKRLGLKLIQEQLGEDISGLYISKGDSTVIAVQKSDHPNRKRFTIAHEIAHFCLRHQFEPGEHVHVDRGHLITPRNSRSSTGIDLKEIEANQFAACLLMPSRLLLDRIKAFKAKSLRDDHVEVFEQLKTNRRVSN
jgi:Zn-dependent peptidase ImmA (M78 family)